MARFGRAPAPSMIYSAGRARAKNGIGFMQRIGCAARAEATLNLFLASRRGVGGPYRASCDRRYRRRRGESYRSDGGWRRRRLWTMPLRALANVMGV
jgi:hypothetical protein